MEKIKQPHGGMLLPGGVPGNKGGGRPKDEIRALMQGGLEKANAKLIEMLEQADLTPEQTTRIADVMAKYSIGTKSEVEQVVVDERIVPAVLDLVAEEFGHDRAVEFAAKLKEKLA